MKRIVLIIIAALLFTGAAYGEVVITREGEKISGTLVEFTREKVVIFSQNRLFELKVSRVQQIVIYPEDESEIKSNPYSRAGVVLKNGNWVSGKPLLIRDGRIFYETDGKENSFDLREVKAVYMGTGSNHGGSSKLSLSVQVGFNFMIESTEKDVWRIDMSISYSEREPYWNFGFGGNLGFFLNLGRHFSLGPVGEYIAFPSGESIYQVNDFVTGTEVKYFLKDKTGLSLRLRFYFKRISEGFFLEGELGTARYGFSVESGDQEKKIHSEWVTSGGFGAGYGFELASQKVLAGINLVYASPTLEEKYFSDHINFMLIEVRTGLSLIF
jgi:opacity protein-like surface antigen